MIGIELENDRRQYTYTSYYASAGEKNRKCLCRPHEFICIIFEFIQLRVLVASAYARTAQDLPACSLNASDDKRRM